MSRVSEFLLIFVSKNPNIKNKYLFFFFFNFFWGGGGGGGGATVSDFLFLGIQI